jgi:5'-nucleotidase (lipoprotein e(P4) family)
MDARDGARQNRRMTKRTSLLLAVVAASFATGACATNPKAEAPKAPAAPVAAAAPAPPSAPAPAASPAAAPRPRPGGGPGLGDGIKWFRTAAEYKAITISVYRAATAAVTAASQGKPRDSWAVVLDADETVLDNSVFQRDLAAGTAPFTEDLWATFARQRSAVPVPGAKAFLDKVKELGGRIAIVTNRWNNLCEDTKENFRLQQIPFDSIACRVDTSDKDPRLAAAATGAAFGDGKAREVLAIVGDNIQDFPTLKQTLREQPDSAFDLFGVRYFVLPNPMYGSWQQNPAR